MHRWLAIGVAMFCLAVPLAASAEQAYPEFTAQYSIKTNGIKTATAVFTLARTEQGEYLYQQQAESAGLASVFSSAKSKQVSRWRFINGQIVVSEFSSKRKGGDDDDNATLVFDWESMRVRNIGAGEQWDIAMPEGTLDAMLMQLALSLDLMRGETVFEYPVAIRGRIKRFQFEQVAEEPVSVASGTYDAVKIQRMDDDKDKSWTWNVPELNYFPVRFLKEKKSGLTVDIILEKLEFKSGAEKPIASPESVPDPVEDPAAAASQSAG